MQFTISTERLTLSPLNTTDARFIFELVNTEGWLEFIGNRNIGSEAKAIPYIQKILDNPNVTYWVVRLNDTGIPIGVITYIKRDYLEHKDIGFAFLPAFAKQGYAIEATKAVLNKLVSEQGLSNVLATTIPKNISSITLLKKLGFTFNKELLINDEMLHVYETSADNLIL